MGKEKISRKAWERKEPAGRRVLIRIATKLNDFRTSVVQRVRVDVRETPYERQKDKKMKEDINKVLSKIRQETSSSQEYQQNVLPSLSSEVTQHTRTSQSRGLPNEGDTRTVNNDQNKRTRGSKRAGAQRNSAVNELTVSFNGLSICNKDNTSTAPWAKTSQQGNTPSSNNTGPRDKYFNVLVQHITYGLANLYITAPVKEFKGCGIKRSAEEAEIF